MEILHRKDLSERIVEKLHSHSSRIWIVSPYVGKLNKVAGILGNNFRTKNLKILVDVSNPTNCDYETLNYLIDKGFEVKSLQMLHAKIYIADNESFITSANLSETAFRKRSEIGVLLNDDYINDIELVFIEYWNEGKAVYKYSEREIESQKKKFKSPGEKRSNFDKNSLSVKTFYDIPEYHKAQPWLKISGMDTYEEKIKPLIIKNVKKESFLGCKSNGKPGLRENDFVVLSRMGIHNDKSDHFIWGRAIVDIPYRGEKDDARTYKNRIKKSNFKNSSDYFRIMESINRWYRGFWIKNLEIIKDPSKYIWLSELTDSSKERLIGVKSVRQQSHIKLSSVKVDIINKKMDRIFKRSGKIYAEPNEAWFNKFIKKESLKVYKEDIR